MNRVAMFNVLKRDADMQAQVRALLVANCVQCASGGYLDEDLSSNNQFILGYLAFVLNHHTHLPRLVPLVQSIASIPKGNYVAEGNYLNRLTELMAIRFVSTILKHNLVELEAVSPHRSANTPKTCDIKTKNPDGIETYFETKDESSVIISQKEEPKDPRFSCISPKLAKALENWINGRVNDCIQKGANYLVARAIAWQVNGALKFTTDWVDAVFPNNSQIDHITFKVALKSQPPDWFKGIYIVSPDDQYLLLIP